MTRRWSGWVGRAGGPLELGWFAQFNWRVWRLRGDVFRIGDYLQVDVSVGPLTVLLSIYWKPRKGGAKAKGR